LSVFTHRRLMPPCLVVLAAAACLALPAASRAETIVSDAAGRTLTVSRTDGLDPDGETVRVSGRGYTAQKGIYVAFCVDHGPGTLPEPCGGGIDTTGASGSSAWISSNPPPYGRDLAVPYGPDGSFSVTIHVAATIGEHDCTGERCSIVTRNDHTRTDDRSQDLAVPIAFARIDPLVVAGGAAVGLAALAGLVGWRRRRRRDAV
jgi:hypothetical protein